MFFLITACADSWDSVKRGLTGQKKVSTDEFLVEKKDPLILPPDFENLPTPSGSVIKEESMETLSIQKTLDATANQSDEISSSSSPEESILKQIRKK